MQTNVVTVVPASEAVKLPPLTGTAAVPAARLAPDEVTYVVHEAGAFPPVTVIGTVAAEEPLLTATTTTVPSVPLKAESRRLALELPVTSTMT